MAQAPILFIPHGGGPLPLMSDPAHTQLVTFLSSVAGHFPRPEAIVVVSAHWEDTRFSIQHQEQPELLYDYHGFPPETYQINYPAPGAPEVASDLAELLSRSEIDFDLDEQRGFDHSLISTHPTSHVWVGRQRHPRSVGRRKNAFLNGVAPAIPRRNTCG